MDNEHLKLEIMWKFFIYSKNKKKNIEKQTILSLNEKKNAYYIIGKLIFYFIILILLFNILLYIIYYINIL